MGPGKSRETWVGGGLGLVLLQGPCCMLVFEQSLRLALSADLLIVRGAPDSLGFDVSQLSDLLASHCPEGTQVA